MRAADTRRPVFIGIDPGFSGAMAVIDAARDVVDVVDAPILTVGDRREMDLAAMRELLVVFADKNAHAFIERVHSMPGSSGRSMFSFGTGYGAWLGELAALQIPTTRVEPARWKAAMMDGMGKEKDAARLRAMMLFPKMAAHFARKTDDGRAEALLIAEYGRRTS